MNSQAIAIDVPRARIVPSMPSAEYHAHPALSRSTLDKIRRSPAHLKHALAHGTPDSDAMRVGRNLHTLLLEPELFWGGTAVWEGRRAGKAWEAFEAAAKAAGKEVVKTDELVPFKAIADSFAAKGLNRILNGQVEHSLFWRCARTEIDCKARPDIIGTDGNVYDLKTTMDARPEEFIKSAYRYGYHRQAAWYLDAVAATGARPSDFIIIAIEKEAPHDVQTFVLDHAFIELGRAENEANLDVYAACARSGQWPGYSSTPQLLTMPPWVKMELDDDQTF